MLVRRKGLSIQSEDNDANEHDAITISEIFSVNWLEDISESDPIFVTIGKAVYKVQKVTVQ